MWSKTRVIALLKWGKGFKDPKSTGLSRCCVVSKRVREAYSFHDKCCTTGKAYPATIPDRGSPTADKYLTWLNWSKMALTRSRLLVLYFFIQQHMTRSLTPHFHLTHMIGILFQNRQFNVSLMGKSNKRRNQKNGLPQGNVQVPTLYNTYTTDKPLSANTRQFIYTDNTTVAAQGRNFEEICAFHLNNKEARQ